ncbi:MAG: hypothetical protein AB1656_26475 [Candidatus Omnitrophota bacterium]
MNESRRLARIAFFGKVLFGRIVFLILFFFLFYSIGIFYLPYSGDGSHIAFLAEEGWAVTMHSPLTAVAHRAAYLILRPFEPKYTAEWYIAAAVNAVMKPMRTMSIGAHPALDAFLSCGAYAESMAQLAKSTHWGWYTTSASSALAGSIALQVLFAIRRHPLFLIANIFTGSFMVFAGEVENYAWINLFLLLTFLYVEKYLLGQARLWPGALCFFIAALFHGLALFYLPPLIWIMTKKKDYRPYEFLLPFLFYIGGYLLLNTALPHEGININIGRLVPWFKINRKGQHFTFFTWIHLYVKTYFHLCASYFGILPAEWPLLFYFRRMIDGDFKRYLLFCSAIGLFWHTLWHPDLGWIDWDLFSQIYIPLHLLLGLLLSEQAEDWRRAGKRRDNA